MAIVLRMAREVLPSGAHGIAGILQTLLQLPAEVALARPDAPDLLQKTAEKLFECCFRSGNMPSSLGNGKDRLVQFCHGATGMISLALRLAEHHPKSAVRYQELAQQFGEVIWRRGLLKKGLGLCHGAPGNGLAMLSLQGELWLNRAKHFAVFCVEHRDELHPLDKYLLVERATNLAAAAELNCLGLLGVGPEQLATLKQWASGVVANEALEAEVPGACQTEDPLPFARDAAEKIPPDPSSITATLEIPQSLLNSARPAGSRKHVEEVSVGGVLRSAITSKVVTKITEYFWNFETNCVLEAFRGVGADASDRMVLWSRQGQVELKTSAKTPAPHPEVRSPAVNKEVNISWLLRILSDPAVPGFSIDRTIKSCKTPRRNQDFDKAYQYFMALSNWTMYVADYINHLRTVQPRKMDDSALSLDHVFIPVVPIMFKEGIGEVDHSIDTLMSALPKGDAEAPPSLVMSASAGNLLLVEQLRSLKEQHENVRNSFPGDTGILTAVEGCISLTLMHMNTLAHQWVQAVDYVESMLRKQLVAAIGKEVSPSEFGSYMRFHYRKLFLDAYQPSQFCFAVRRSEQHGPEGTVSIEEETFGDAGSLMHTPIVTLENHGSTPTAMSFPLSASTTVSFTGPVHLHGWLCHSFSGQTGSGLFLKARARQFSSMLVLVGRVTSATSFDPTYAAIIQNKDELTIPLEMSVIPTPKEFKDAIASLSPEQQQFAKAFRAMQLESTLFGVLVVQIKPQLEKLLNLPDDSLTKEIKLTQDLMELFLKYQIPSDLLSFSEEEGVSETVTAAPARLGAVRGHVKAMFDMINQEKQEELEESRKQAQYSAPLVDLNDLLGGSRSGSSEIPEMEMDMCCEVAVGSFGGSATESRDYTQVPQEMDAQFEKLDPDSSLRPTIINIGNTWKKRSQKALLAEPTEAQLTSDHQKQEKDAAFDLLDAITKSGALPLSHATLHIVIAATHCFDKTVLETVVQENVNPIEKVERSTLIMASTVHQQPAASLINQSSFPRVTAASPQLFVKDGD
ncbi:LanC-like protein 2 (Testis-specific adriamycin sensitivity protein) [Durusdinium trenchii]|uniref:LanC-like protein 2 (Testis-specific adriamycin sensitivity protein) n=1 Tax=Durusdinium trenchii TaxID=1381693 RepID=A0ABP0PJW2_9DINO